MIDWLICKYCYYLQNYLFIKILFIKFAQKNIPTLTVTVQN